MQKPNDHWGGGRERDRPSRSSQAEEDQGSSIHGGCSINEDVREGFLISNLNRMNETPVPSGIWLFFFAIRAPQSDVTEDEASRLTLFPTRLVRPEASPQLP